jgi:hypothetical protein
LMSVGNENAIGVHGPSHFIIMFSIAHDHRLLLSNPQPFDEILPQMKLAGGILTSPWDRLHLSRLDWLKVVVSGAWQRLMGELWIIRRWNTCGNWLSRA